MESQAQLSTVTATAPFVPTSGWCLGTSLRVYEQHLESSTTDGAPVAEGLPEEANGIGDPRKTTETETRTSWEPVYA